MLDTIINVILPILLVMVIGGIYGRLMKPNPKTISSLIIYVFAPALIVVGLANVDVDGTTFINVSVLTFGVAIIITILSIFISRILRFDLRTESALILSVILFNGANYGLPFNLYVFGIEAENIAILYYSISILVTNTLGIYIISRGENVKTLQAMSNIFRIPLFYAAIIGIGLNLLGVRIIADPALVTPDMNTIPIPIARVIDILASGTIPAMLVLIGVQISQLTINVHKLRPMLVATALTLVVSPFITLILANIINLESLATQVGIIQHAMPTAVIASALATQFDSDSELVAGTLLLSTGLSILSLSVWVQIV
jgi:malate permease and related proteins